ncbi:MAG: hypothetical protein ABSB60_03565 [Terracidiphilus sp.]|jgi:hypothetical protein
MDALQDHLPQIVTAIGGLGTAAFGLLDAFKSVIPWINHIGFGRIHSTASGLSPESADAKLPANALPQKDIIDSLLANWVNGTDLKSQKAIAKTLIKLHLSESNANALAAATNVDPKLLSSVAVKTLKGDPLAPEESDAFSRFDLIVTAQLDEAYQHGDQVYRNWTRALAALLAVALAAVGAWTLATNPTTMAGAQATSFWQSKELFQAILIGLLATPLAPIAKDISSALATAVNTMQSIKK